MALKNKILSILALASATTIAFSGSVTYAATSKPVHTTSSVNGQLVASMTALTVNGQTYVPVPDAQLLLNKILGLSSSQDRWIAKKRVLALKLKANVKPTSLRSKGGNATIVVNGKAFDRHVKTLLHGRQTYVSIDEIQKLINAIYDLPANNDTIQLNGKTGTWAITIPTPKTPRGVTKQTAITILERTLGVKPDSTGKNPYSDVSASHWGYIHTALEKGWIKPDGSTTFGANDSVTVAWVDQFFWSYLGMGHAQYQPGGYASAWANIYGVNRGLNTANANVMPKDMGILRNNLVELQRGWYYSDGEYHLLVPPVDESLYQTGNTQPIIPANLFQNILTKSIRIMDSVTFQVRNNQVEVVLPTISDANDWAFTVGVSKGNLTYSFDGGQTWKSSNGFFTNLWTIGGKTWGDPYLATDQVLVKIPVGVHFGVNLLTQGSYLKQYKGEPQYGAGLAILVHSDGSVSTKEVP